MNAPPTSEAPAVDDCWNRIGVWSRLAASCPRLQQYIHCRNCEHYSASGRRVLERPVPEDYRREWTERFAQPEAAAEAAANSVLVFRLGDEWLGIDSRYISEVTHVGKVHSVPHRTDRVIKGLINIRGELRLCVSIGSILHLEKATENHFVDREILERMILVEKDDQSFVFPVSEVYGIVRYADQQVRALPATVAHAKSKLTTGIVAWKEHSVGILDHELLFYALAKGVT